MRIVFNEFIWLPELALFFWLSIILTISLSTYLAIALINRGKNRKRLALEFNDGYCKKCGSEFEQIICENEYAVYVCPKCGNTIKVDDGAVDFNYGLRKL